MNRNSSLVLLMIFVILFTVGCSAKKVDGDVSGEVKLAFDPTSVDYNNLPLATLELETGEIIKISLFPDLAPNTVNNFISLVQSGFYDGLTFHRVVPNFMIQGGDPLGTGMGDPGYSIKGEFTSNGFDNTLSHVRGVVSMARSNDNDSAGSQFFIMQGDYTKLDGEYAAFGYVIEGIEVADRIVTLDTNKSDMPIEPIVIKKITLDLNGYEAADLVKFEK